ncbi:DUF4378 domain-containing protein/VARLMGL domain-containing protein [Heracleum sosnowskyi]|uniref:DUF4378 domain-containing protein/VARLMGL domain-containing protein n=1 Tax=Heracleum sosnowskyi TaxID=360622 RepID=A0AAD8MT07_9APIA|nr:DUF4378 domain-containing protein/VARLMGL domain-containing protein [Heracleum sosnowskyi]
MVRPKDLPRSLHSSKINDGIYSNGLDERQNLSVDLQESLKHFAQVRDIQPWYLDEPSLLSRSSSFQLRHQSSYSTPNDAPRYSFDEWGRSHLSYGSQDSLKQTLKMKELPILSLDSRENSMRSFNSEAQSSFMSKSMRKDSGNLSEHLLPSNYQTYKSQQRPPSVVAKLMGLESLSNSASNTEYMSGSDPVNKLENSLRSSKVTDVYRPIQTIDSSRNSWKEHTSPRWRNSDPVMKPKSKASIEPAPWPLLDGARGSQKVVPRKLKSLQRAPGPFPSVYSEIENRLKDLEFRQSGKDLRALKQILEAMQVKGLVDTSKAGHGTKFPNQQDHYTSPNQNTKAMKEKQKRNDHVSSHTSQRSSSSKFSESPIFIMKPVKFVEKSGNRTSVSPLDDRLSNESRRQGNDFSDKKNGSARNGKHQIPKSNCREHMETSNDRKANVRTPKTPISKRQQQLPRESIANSVKSPGSISPRLQQKRLELEKRSRPPISPSDFSKLKKQPSNKQQLESTSPGRRCRLKSLNMQQCDDQTSEISSESRNSNYRDDNSLVSEELSSSARPGEINGHQSPFMHTSKYSRGLAAKNQIVLRNEDESVAELGTTSPEYPSPVSVLDGAVYIDNAPSPSNQTLDAKDNSVWKSNDIVTEEQWHPVDSNKSSTLESGFKSKVNRKKLQSIDQLVQKLRRLNSGHDEARTDYIASLCENTSPDDRYISEILLASGLLLRDLGSNLTTFQFHQSGDPINPDLFLVLEQTKASTLLKENYRSEKIVQLNSDDEKNHRKLIFDTVNEVLSVKLACLGHPTEPRLKPLTLTRKTLNAQKLMRELCSDIEQLQAKKPACSLEDENDGLKSILWEDVLHRSESFTDFHGEISGLVLVIERSLFKDLVGEIVAGESAIWRIKAGRHRRQLFVK